ncbi:MAG TPA: DUF2079 domain-containing protein [Candidatus Acidoferrales bacterium]|nr:DUF2079 domain-containing protein [Candidatus Acidoferrales bacterium]
MRSRCASAIRWSRRASAPTSWRGISRIAFSVWGAAALYAAVWFALGVWRYTIFRASFDDGIFTQIISSAFSGFQGTPEFGGFNHLAVHFSPDLFLLAPILLGTHSTISLIAVQAVAGALVAPPLYFIARKRMPDRLAAACAVIALLYPPLASITFADFHENGIEPAAIAWLLWAIDAKKILPAVFLALFALGIKEDVAPGLIAGGFFSGLWLLRRGDKLRSRLSLAVGAMALIVFAGYFTVMRPLLHPPFAYSQLHFYDWGPAAVSVGGGLVGAFDPVRAQYLAMVLAPVAALPFLTPAMLLAIPGLVEILVSHDRILLVFETEYAAVWIGYVLFAFVLGAAALYGRSPRAARAALILAALISTGVLIKGDPMARWYRLYRMPNAHDAVLSATLSSLPADADLSVPDNLYAHVGFDPHAGNDFGRRYVVVDRTDHDLSPVWRRNVEELGKLVRVGTYGLVRSVDGVEVYERKP